METTRYYLRFFSLVCLLLVARVSSQAQLYGLSSSRPGSLYTINTSTGAATLVTDLTGTFIAQRPGLEFLGGTLYATDVKTESFSFLKFGTIDLTTGAFTAINSQGFSANWHGLAANEAAGLFYIIDGDDNNNLKTVTPGGVITTIGPSGILARGMAYDGVHGILYAVDFFALEVSLYTVDVATGASTLIGKLGIDPNPVGFSFEYGLAYDPVADILYENTGKLITPGNQNGSLYTVNTTTGAATLVGSNGSVPGDGIGGLAFLSPQSRVPEPGILALSSGIAMLGFTLVRRKRSA